MTNLTKNEQGNWNLVTDDSDDILLLLSSESFTATVGTHDERVGNGFEKCVKLEGVLAYDSVNLL